MSILTTYNALVTALANFRTDIAAADGSTAYKAANKDLATRVADDVGAALGEDAGVRSGIGKRLKDRVTTAGQ